MVQPATLTVVVILERPVFVLGKGEPEGNGGDGRGELKGIRGNRKGKGPEACSGYGHSLTSIPPAPANRHPTTFLSMCGECVDPKRAVEAKMEGVLNR